MQPHAPVDRLRSIVLNGSASQPSVRPSDSRTSGSRWDLPDASTGQLFFCRVCNVFVISQGPSSSNQCTAAAVSVNIQPLRPQTALAQASRAARLLVPGPAAVRGLTMAPPPPTPAPRELRSAAAATGRPGPHPAPAPAAASAASQVCACSLMVHSRSVWGLLNRSGCKPSRAAPSACTRGREAVALQAEAAQVVWRLQHVTLCVNCHMVDAQIRRQVCGMHLQHMVARQQHVMCS